MPVPPCLRQRDSAYATVAHQAQVFCTLREHTSLQRIHIYHKLCFYYGDDCPTCARLEKNSPQTGLALSHLSNHNLCHDREHERTIVHVFWQPLPVYPRRQLLA